MSMTITLIPMVIAIGSVVSGASLKAAVTCTEDGMIGPIDTMYTDKDLLIRTFCERGLAVRELDEDRLAVHTEAGELILTRTQAGEPFTLNGRNISNNDELMRSLREFEEEYGRNVQTYTRKKILEALEEHGMMLEEEEVADDDSVLLTIRI